MRVSSLSNPQVIRLLSQYFVPVWFSRDDYQVAPAAKAEREEVMRINRDAHARRLEHGNVCVFLIDPDGTVFATLMVQKAANVANLTALLKKTIEDKKLSPREAPAARAEAPRRVPVKAKEGGVVLHLWTRFVDNRADLGLSEDWVALGPDEWAAFVPPDGAKVGSSWEVPGKVSDKLFRYFYPPGPNWQVKDSTLVSGTLKATYGATAAGEVRIDLRGRAELSHPFGGKDTDGQVTAKLVGVVRYNPAKKALTAFALTSEEANYVWRYKGNAQPQRMALAVELEP
jgi:hypothetical protein